MIKLTIVATRPNINVPWSRTLTQTIINHIVSNYINTGKLLVNVTKVADLTQTGILVFYNQAALDEWNADPAFAARNAERSAYNEANNITVQTTTATIDTSDADFTQHLGYLGFTDANNNVVSHEPYVKP